MAHVSLRDVADHAGVSFQTVSKVLKGEGRVRADTRQRILATAEELGYVPNTLARSLATRHTKTIGLVTSGLASFVLAPLIHGAEEEARRRGYLTLVTLAEGGEDHAVRILNQFIERRVDGIINAGMTLQHDPKYAELLRKAVPVVSFYPIKGGGVPIVGPDPTAIGLLATRRLIELGHRRIASICDVSTLAVARRGRLRGYEIALSEVGCALDPALIDHGEWTAEGGYAAMNRLLDRVPAITAVFAHNDHMAIGAIKALEDRGLRCPEDCALVGVDDIDLARYGNPTLTSVRISFEQCGEVAVQLLVDQLASGQAPPDQVTLPVELVVRRSCGDPIHPRAAVT